MSQSVDPTRVQAPDAVPDVPVPPPAAGDAVPGLSSWVLERRLGGGGFGEVWLARHAWDADHPPRAVKFCTDPAARHRLAAHERDVVLRVMRHTGRHPHIVPLLECNLDAGIPWLMYPYVEGCTLADLVPGWREYPTPARVGEAVRALRAVAAALAACHRLVPPLIHRDVKPQNVLMAGGTVPKVTDFGIGGLAATDDPAATQSVRMPSALRTAGTRTYSSPEQTFGSPPDPRDDVYALGVMAYQLVLADLATVPGADAALELRAAGVPDELAGLILASVAVNPDRRPRDATHWETALAAMPAPPAPRPALGSLPVLLPEPGVVWPPPGLTAVLPEPPAPARVPRRRRRAVAAVVALALAVAVGVLAWRLTRPGERADPPAPPAAAAPATPTSTGPRPGDTLDVEIADGVTMTFCWVPAGECQLGSPKAERDAVAKALGAEPSWLAAEAEERRGRFRTGGFWMGKYEVTQAQWRAVTAGSSLADAPTFRPGGRGAEWLDGAGDPGRLPADNVSWDDCQQFLARVNARRGARPLGLPHEDAWEYAARGGRGNGRPFYWGAAADGTQANINGTVPFGTAAAGPNLHRPAAVGSYETKVPHPWGLCDLHGNVAEWCDNHRGPNDGALRGGSWIDPDGGRAARAARLGRWTPWHRHSGNGFRLVVRDAP